MRIHDQTEDAFASFRSVMTSNFNSLAAQLSRLPLVAHLEKVKKSRLEPGQSRPQPRCAAPVFLSLSASAGGALPSL